MQPVIKRVYWTRTKPPDWLSHPVRGCDQALERIQDVLEEWQKDLEQEMEKEEYAYDWE